MIIETLFPDIQYSKKEKRVKAEPREKAKSKYNREEYKPPVFIGQNLYIKPSYIVSIPEFHSYNKALSNKSLENQKNLLENDRKGKLSRKAIQGLRNAINWLCLAAKKKHVYDRKTEKTFNFKVNFITLTLPDTKEPINSPDLQKQLLNPFLTYMRKYHNLSNYVWRLEFQANGKLHVHITTDTFLHLGVIRNTWNNLLDKYGYLDEFYKANGHKNPNSTDVHATKKIKNMAAYLAKYMSKKNSMYFEKEKAILEKLKVEANYKDEKKLKAFELLLRKENKIFKYNGMRGNFAVKTGWYTQRLNFWNSPFNPRPIVGRIWSCNYELSRANKLVVHIPASDCSTDLKCLFNPEIQYKELYSAAPELDQRYTPEDPRNQPRKIGEVYFIKAKDWLDKMNGVIRKTFDDARAAIQNTTVTNFVLDYS
jgi:hypothetical protein